MKRRRILLASLLFLYLFSYGGLRLAKIYVHGTGMYRDGQRHRVQVGNTLPIVEIPASVLLLLHYPLKISEEIYWNRDRLSDYFKNGFDKTM